MVLVEDFLEFLVVIEVGIVAAAVALFTGIGCRGQFNIFFEGLLDVETALSVANFALDISELFDFLEVVESAGLEPTGHVAAYAVKIEVFSSLFQGIISSGMAAFLPRVILRGVANFTLFDSGVKITEAVFWFALH